jgi:uncharacterized protein (TIGR03382 family)
MTLVISSTIGERGETVTIDVLLETAVEVIETDNDIVLGPEIQIATAADGRPLCTVHPAIGKDATFTLECDETGVCTLRALILASDERDPIPNGSVLYSCEISIDRDAGSGTYPLVCANSTADEGLSMACVDGSVEVVRGSRHDDGCQASGRTGGPDPWLAALPAALLWLRRRRFVSQESGRRNWPSLRAHPLS